MSNKRCQSDEDDSISVDKRTKTESHFLDIQDENAVEEDYQPIFQTIAHRLINQHELVVANQHCFRLAELEFYYYHPTRHADTFAHRHPDQTEHSLWYFHRQGTSATASYKAGTYKGLDITFGSSFGGILIRSIENKQTGKIFEGSCLVVDALLNLCQCQTIQELVQIKMKSNRSIFDQNQLIFLRPVETVNVEELIASPRVGLTLKVPSVDRERFLFRPYRFTPKDYYPSKMKMTILLALAAARFFSSNKGQLTDHANDLVVQTNTRLATVTTNLKDLQKGYDEDVSSKTSPLVDFYKTTLTASTLARAYGIWLRHYRTTKTS